MQISVTGQERRQVAPERAEVTVTIEAEGVDRPRVIADVTAAANALAAEASRLQDAGSVTRHVVRPLRTSVWRRTPRSAEQVTASVELAVTFADFEELSRRTADWGARDGVRIGWVRWFLTEQTTRAVTDEAIATAVARGRERAEAMGRAAGVHELEIVEIADPGLLGTPESTIHLGGGAPRMLAMARTAAAEVAPEPVQIAPEPLDVTVTLQLRFSGR